MGPFSAQAEKISRWPCGAQSTSTTCQRGSLSAQVLQLVSVQVIDRHILPARVFIDDGERDAPCTWSPRHVHEPSDFAAAQQESFVSAPGAHHPQVSVRVKVERAEIQKPRPVWRPHRIGMGHPRHAGAGEAPTVLTAKVGRVDLVPLGSPRVVGDAISRARHGGAAQARREHQDHRRRGPEHHRHQVPTIQRPDGGSLPASRQLVGRRSRPSRPAHDDSRSTTLTQHPRAIATSVSEGSDALSVLRQIVRVGVRRSALHGSPAPVETTEAYVRRWNSMRPVGRVVWA